MAEIYEVYEEITPNTTFFLSLDLPSYKLSEKEGLRYIGLLRDGSVSLSAEPNNEAVPLFLGSDVLTGTLRSAKNHSRIHARYAKAGLATKLYFEDFRVEGISNSASLWFYTVQGLFEVVFMHHDRPMQRQCLLHLKDMWLMRFGDPLLPESLQVKLTVTEMEYHMQLYKYGLKPNQCGKAKDKSEECLNDKGQQEVNLHPVMSSDAKSQGTASSLQVSGHVNNTEDRSNCSEKTKNTYNTNENNLSNTSGTTVVTNSSVGMNGKEISKLGTEVDIGAQKSRSPSEAVVPEKKAKAPSKEISSSQSSTDGCLGEIQEKMEIKGTAENAGMNQKDKGEMDRLGTTSEKHNEDQPGVSLGSDFLCRNCKMICASIPKAEGESVPSSGKFSDKKKNSVLRLRRLKVKNGRLLKPCHSMCTKSVAMGTQNNANSNSQFSMKLRQKPLYIDRFSLSGVRKAFRNQRAISGSVLNETDKVEVLYHKFRYLKDGAACRTNGRQTMDKGIQTEQPDKDSQMSVLTDVAMEVTIHDMLNPQPSKDSPISEKTHDAMDTAEAEGSRPSARTAYVIDTRKEKGQSSHIQCTPVAQSVIHVHRPSFVTSKHKKNKSWQMLLQDVYDFVSKYQPGGKPGQMNKMFLLLNLMRHEVSVSDNSGFEFELVQLYLDHLQVMSSLDVQNPFEIPHERFVFLTVICKWLGNEFHKLENKITQKVEHFKLQHINCIDNLPPAEEIIDQVFPEFMKELVFHWTGQSVAMTTDSSLGQDHTYGSMLRFSEMKASDQSSFPLIQFILEFANNALISGVAHVVYSKVKNSV